MLLGNYDPATHTGIAKAAKSLKWHLNVSMLNSFQLPSKWEGDGIICSLDDNPLLEEFVLNSGLPCVDLSSWRMDLKLPRVSADNRMIGHIAAEHFLEYGHQSFAWFSYHRNNIAELRCQSFKQYLEDRGHKNFHRLVGKKAQTSEHLTKWLNSLPRPTAIFSYNDMNASWLLNCCIENGFRVPEDFAILGVDNNGLICEHQTTPLSSINHDHERIGYEGALLLDSIIKGNPAPGSVQYVAPNGITIRGSSDALAVDDELVKEVLKYLKENLRKPIGIEQLSVMFSVSRRTLEIRFKNALHTSLHKKLQSFRLRHAHELITKTDRSIEDIAALSGFCHAPHLCRIFKKEYGRTPLGVRKSK